MTGPSRQPSPRTLPRPAYGMPGRAPVQPGLQPSPPGPPPAEQPEQGNAIRSLCFYALLVLIFIRFSMLHQLLTFKLGINLYLLFIFGIPPILGVILTGGLGRIFRYRPSIYWIGFAFCMLTSIPFSSWKGGSVETVSTYIRTDFLMLFLMGGLAVNWKECRAMMTSIGLAALASIVIIQVFKQVDENGRINLEFGSIQNSNDYAAHLLLVLPFLLWIGMTSKSLLFRIVALLGLSYGCIQIVASASRGAAIALVVVVLTVLSASSAKQKAVAGAVVMAMLAASAAIVPQKALQRILSFSNDDSAASLEALESSHIRKQLLQDAVMAAITHPVTGVGAGQFPDYEGKLRRVVNQPGLFYNAHNSYVQVASECGLGAFVFYVAGIVSPLLLLSRISRRVKNTSARDVQNTVLCLRATYAGFCTAITFVNFAYFFYLPAIAGMIIAMAAAVEKMPLESPAPQQQLPQFAPRRKPLPPRTAAAL